MISAFIVAFVAVLIWKKLVAEPKEPKRNERGRIPYEDHMDRLRSRLGIDHREETMTWGHRLSPPLTYNARYSPRFHSDGIVPTASQCGDVGHSLTCCEVQNEMPVQLTHKGAFMKRRPPSR